MSLKLTAPPSEIDPTNFSDRTISDFDFPKYHAVIPFSKFTGIDKSIASSVSIVLAESLRQNKFINHG